MAGFLQGGGVGKTLAEWMIHGEPAEDAFALDIARYGPHASNREYIRQTTGEFYARRFVMTYPNEQLPAGRPLKTTPSYDAMTAAGCQWGHSWGLETPLYFAPAGFSGKADAQALERLRYRRRGMPRRARARRPPRYRAFSRYEVTGPEAERWLDSMTVARLPKPGARSSLRCCRRQGSSRAT